MTQHLAKIALTDMQAELRDQAMRFCADKSPIAKVRSLLTDDHGFDAAVWAEMAALGWLGIAIPEDYEGLGLELADLVPVVEAMGKHLMHSPFVSTTLAAQAILAGGSDAQTALWLPKLASGTVATVALFEPTGAWDLNAVEGQTKTFVMDLDASELIVTTVKFEGQTRLALIPRDRITARRETIIDEMKRSYTFEVPDVTESDLMPAKDAVTALERIELVANLLQAAELSGAAMACIDYTVDYLKTRKQFGKVIGAFQALKHPTVDAFVDAEGARSLLYAAATHCEKQGEGEIAVRMANAKAEGALSFAADRSIQFHGGFGFTYDCDAQLYRRKAMFAASQFGDAAFHRARLAELLL
ncbi:acyl-CoA dehydrogenase [Algimonas arctica]|uniref:Acyl-CoA dehydrogenase n=1 Tax=Algimonas arctica TaxID=1479486 RepID=A0A8J3CS17_9PROT|nr:acyl-CoA dehydrogenase family protein [Algimonas arctica]GHA92669.1 acyl-CoA dehydrogenase [Algimonas arctica]